MRIRVTCGSHQDVRVRQLFPNKRTCCAACGRSDKGHELTYSAAHVPKYTAVPKDPEKVADKPMQTV